MISGKKRTKKSSLVKKSSSFVAIKEVKGNETVSHLPRKFSRIGWYFLALGGEISVKEIGRRRCGGMEVPCQLEAAQTKYKENS